MIFGFLPVTQSCYIIVLLTPCFWCPSSYTILLHYHGFWCPFNTTIPHYPTSDIMIFCALPVTQSCYIIPLPTPWFLCPSSYTILLHYPTSDTMVFGVLSVTQSTCATMVFGVLPVTQSCYIIPLQTPWFLVSFQLHNPPTLSHF